MTPDVLEYDGASFLIMRLVLALITGKKVCISNIRPGTGLLQEEENLLELFEKLTLGSEAIISDHNEKLTYTPGTLQGCDGLRHECHPNQPLGYYLMPIIALAPLTQLGCMDLKLIGSTSHSYLPFNEESRSKSSTEWPSVDFIRQIIIPSLKFIDESLRDAGLEVKEVGFRGSAGQIILRIPSIKKVKAMRLMDLGRIKRIRGTAALIGVNKTFAAKLKAVTMKKFSDMCPDVFVYENQRSGASLVKGYTDLEAPMKGYGLVLLAESDNGICTGGECHTDNITLKDLREYITAENLSKDHITEAECVAHIASARLLSELMRGGVVGTYLQSIFVIYLGLGEETIVGMLRLGELLPETEMLIRHLQDFINIKFNIYNDLYKETNTEEITKKVQAGKSGASLVHSESPSESSASDLSDDSGASQEEEDIGLRCMSSVILRCVGRGFVNINKAN